MTERIRILGIDPGSRFTGFGVVDFTGDTPTYVASGTIRSPNGSFPDRLRKIFESVGEIVEQYEPAVVSIEARGAKKSNSSSSNSFLIVEVKQNGKGMIGETTQPCSPGASAKPSVRR